MRYLKTYIRSINETKMPSITMEEYHDRMKDPEYIAFRKSQIPDWVKDPEIGDIYKVFYINGKDIVEVVDCDPDATADNFQNVCYRDLFHMRDDEDWYPAKKHQPYWDSMAAIETRNLLTAEEQEMVDELKSSEKFGI